MTAEKALKFKKKTTKAKLTRRTIKALPLPAPSEDGRPSQSWTYDSATARLAICCWSTGSRTWYWIGRVTGRPARIKLGEYPEMVPEQASRRAAKLSVEVADGVDPRTERRRARAEMTLAELLDRYLDDHAKVHKKTWQEDAAQFGRYCGPLKSRTLSTIDRATMTSLHARVGRDHGKYAANRLLALFSMMFAFATKDLKFEGSNPAKGIKKFREQTRERYLTAAELGRFFAALDAESQLVKDFFIVLLLTGARRGNVQAMRFDQIDFAQNLWRIPDSKNGDALSVHVTADALEILRRRHAQSKGSPWVFPGGRKNPYGHLANPKHAWERVVRRAGLDDLHMHDLRRTLGSWQAAGGTSLLIIGKSLGHKSLEATKIYSRLDLAPVRASVDTAVGAMMAAANAHKGGGEA